MTDKEIKKYKKTVTGYLNKWVPLLGLTSCNLSIEFTDEARLSEDGMSLIAETASSWQYNSAMIVFHLGNFDKIKPERLEMAVLHELVHILVHEMRSCKESDGTDHEERVVCGITDALMSVHTAHAYKR